MAPDRRKTHTGCSGGCGSGPLRNRPTTTHSLDFRPCGIERLSFSGGANRLARIRTIRPRLYAGAPRPARDPRIVQMCADAMLPPSRQVGERNDKRGTTDMKRMMIFGMVLAALAGAFGAIAQVVPQPPYLKCFRDEGGNLHEVFEKMPDPPPQPKPRAETPPPTIQVVPPTPTTTTLPSFSFNYTPKLYWRLRCPTGVMWGPYTDAGECIMQRAWLNATCPKKRVDRRDGFTSVEAIRLFRQACGADNGISCSCQPEYW